MKPPDEVKTVVEDVRDNGALPSGDDNEKKKLSKWKIVQSANQQIVPPRLLLPSQIKINQILEELKKFSVDDTNPSKSVHSITGNSSRDYLQFIHQRLKRFLLHTRFHYLIIILVLIDLIVVLGDLVLGECQRLFSLLSPDPCSINV
jgi:hypothetical protein